MEIPLKFQKKIIQKSSDVRIYRGATLITPGEWTDGASRIPTTYTPGHLQLGSTVWTKNYLNLDHEWKVNSLIGTVQNQYWDGTAVRGDLYINPQLSVGKDTITKIDTGLIKSLSVELMAEDVYDDDQNKVFATNIEFIGCAVIYGEMGACPEAKI